MDLLQMDFENNLKKQAPLAIRMRPNKFEEFIGQEHIVGENRILKRSIEEDNLQSIILFGPSGSGKTALAELISKISNSNFQSINAVMAGVADIKRIVEEAKTRRSISGAKTVVFVDEIHRFNKSQQDALLPFVESGLLILIGATTENPMISVNTALLSRTKVFKFEPLKNEHLKIILKNALEDEDRGLGKFDVKIDDGAVDHLVMASSGDARFLLNSIEFAVLTTIPDKNNIRNITIDIMKEATQKRTLDYDNTTMHYDVISAFIKSMRGSDPQATIYWLARMIYAGEDPMFIARRIVICASEDVGLADSNALLIANAALQIVKNIGMPEGRITLAHAAIYLALAPKSNSSYLAINSSIKIVEETCNLEVPFHLKDKTYRENYNDKEEIIYKYPHDFEGHIVIQKYLPSEIKDEVFYIKSINDK